MKRKTYSAGAVKHSFWFYEFRKMIMLLLVGSNMKEIQTMCRKDNIFFASTASRAEQIYRTVSRRVCSLDAQLYSYFDGSDFATQKIISLISIMETDTLFYDFMHDVFRVKLAAGAESLFESDIYDFFKYKQLYDARASEWTDGTLKRLGASYRLFLIEAGVAKRDDGLVRIIKPILDIDLMNILMRNSMESYRDLFAGV